MPRRLTVTLLPLFLLSLSAAQAQDAPAISGFFDLQADRVFSLGSLELDLAKELGKSAQLSAAVVTDGHTANLAVGYVDVHLIGGLIAPRGRVPAEKGLHVQIGRFDVPFGNDWQYFASKDRVELSAPLTTDAIMDGGYNDTGIRVFGNTPSFHYSAFALRGDRDGRVFGSRLGFTPRPDTHILEAGVSFLRKSASGETIFAVDSESRVGRCHLRGEYIRDGVSAWQVTASFDAGTHAGMAVTPFARYDALHEDGSRNGRVTAGINAGVLSHVVLKFEYRRAIAKPVESRDAFAAQAVFVF